MPTVTHTTAENDSQDVENASGVFGDGSILLALTPGGNSYIGLVFDFGLTLDGTTGVPINPPIIDGSSFTLAITQLSGHTDAFLQLFFVDELNPDDFSASRLPGTLSTETAASSVDALVAGENSWTFGDGNPNTWETWERNLFGYVRNSNWEGRLAFVIALTGGVEGAYTFVASEHTTNTNYPTLTTTETPFHTGHEVGGIGKRGRARHCARSGLPANTADLVEDGYTEGIWVLPDWREPEDRTGLDTQVSSTEGEIDDKVTGDS